MEIVKGKPVCEFGEECYRKNPDHLTKFYHPSKETDNASNSKDTKKSPVDLKTAKTVDQKKAMKQTTLNFFKTTKTPNNDSASSSKDEKKAALLPKEKPEEHSPKRKCSPLPKRRKRSRKAIKVLSTTVSSSSEEETEKNGDESIGDVTSNSWTFSKTLTADEEFEKSIADDSILAAVVDGETDCKTIEEKVKKLFLVDMPQDFYSFYEFCENQNGKEPCYALKSFGLSLVGPFHVLSGKLDPKKIRVNDALCHWRFYMDPPEMQTVMVAEKGLHYAYWRDDPSTKNVFVVSNTVPEPKILPVAGNLFGAVSIHLEGYLRQCSPFEKVKANKVLTSLRHWAEEREFDLSDTTPSMRERKKNVVATTFNGLGIVVPVDKKTDLGYRPLIESNATLKKFCLAVMNAKSDKERDSKMEQIDILVNAANIANDECDFGNGLELGIDLFCMGSEIFHETIEHLLSTAYSLLNRPEWATIIKAHLKNRRPGLNLSVIR